MRTQTNYVRHGIGCLRPYIYGPLELPEFVRKTFDALELERHEFGPQSFHVELQIGDSVIVIEAGDLSPDVSPWKSSIYVYVENVDAIYARALELGAKSVVQVEDKPYQERQGGFLDMAGNTWWVATYKQSAAKSNL